MVQGSPDGIFLKNLAQEFEPVAREGLGIGYTGPRFLNDSKYARECFGTAHALAKSGHTLGLTDRISA